MGAVRNKQYNVVRNDEDEWAAFNGKLYNLDDVDIALIPQNAPYTFVFTNHDKGAFLPSRIDCMLMAYVLTQRGTAIIVPMACKLADKKLTQGNILELKISVLDVKYEPVNIG